MFERFTSVNYCGFFLVIPLGLVYCDYDHCCSITTEPLNITEVKRHWKIIQKKIESPIASTSNIVYFNPPKNLDLINIHISSDFCPNLNRSFPAQIPIYFLYKSAQSFSPNISHTPTILNTTQKITAKF